MPRLRAIFAMSIHPGPASCAESWGWGEDPEQILPPTYHAIPMAYSTSSRVALPHSSMTSRLVFKLCALLFYWALADGQPQPALGAIPSTSQVHIGRSDPLHCSLDTVTCFFGCFPSAWLEGQDRIPPPESWHEALLGIDIHLQFPDDVLGFLQRLLPDWSGSHPPDDEHWLPVTHVTVGEQLAPLFPPLIPVFEV